MKSFKDWFDVEKAIQVTNWALCLACLLRSRWLICFVCCVGILVVAIGIYIKGTAKKIILCLPLVIYGVILVGNIIVAFL